MKKKLKERYRPDDKLRTIIMDKLQTRTEKGDIPVVSVMPESEICPICGSEPSFVYDKDKTGKRTKREIVPFKVDYKNLHFRCTECSFQGSPVNYIMITRKITHEEAIKYLRKYVGA